MITLGALLVLFSSGLGQNDANEEFRVFPSAMASETRAFAEARTKPTVPAISIPDTLFFLSPGDQLLLRWWGVGEGREDLVVDTRRELVLPDIGRISVERLNLRKLRDSIQSIYQRRVRANLIDLQVVHVSKARIAVIGFAPTTGPMSIPSGTSVSEALGMAGIDVDKSLVQQAFYETAFDPRNRVLPSLRRVVLRRSGGDSAILDLARAVSHASTADDPPLFSGDVLVLRPRGRFVLISGNVPRSGEFETVPGETVAASLLAAGVSEVPEQVEVSLTTGEVRSIPSKTLLGEDIKMIHVPWSSPEVRPAIVWVFGEVRRPGPVPEAKARTVSEALREAGGLSIPEDSAVVMPVRRGWQMMMTPRSQRSVEAMQIPEVRQALIGHSARMKGNYSRDEALLSAGDTVWAHRAEMVVWVGGAVMRPGFVSWRKGADMTDYVELAGGFAKNASKGKMVAFDLYTDQQVGRGQELRPGAAVVVPEKKYIDALTWLAAVGTIVSLFVTAGTFYITATQ